METRMMSAQEKTLAQPAYIYQSDFFSIPLLDAAQPESNKDEVILRSVVTALNHHSSNLKHAPDALAKKSAVARDLVALVKTLPPNLCLNILIESSRHSLFTNSPAHQIIFAAISRETLYRSPVIVGEHTLEKVKFLHQSNPVEVENFLRNPELLLIWIEHADGLETSRLFKYYFQCDSLYYLKLLAIAKEEIAIGQPGKAVLCAALMNAKRPASGDIHYIKQALVRLTENEPSSSYPRIIKSLNLYLDPTIDNFNKAAGCYINANFIELNIAEFTAHDFRGARLTSCNLDLLGITNIDFSGACLDHASLSGIEMNGSNFSGASLIGANLTLSNFINNNLDGADFSGADFSYANLTRANLKNAIFDNAIFDGTEFIVATKFYDPLALEAELDRYHHMLLLHRNETRLRGAIIKQIIQFTHHPEVDTATAVAILSSTLSHDFSKQHNPVELLKTGATFFSNYFQAAFYKTDLPSVPSIDTNEEKLLKPELEKRKAELAAASAPRPM